MERIKPISGGPAMPKPPDKTRRERDDKPQPDFEEILEQEQGEQEPDTEEPETGEQSQQDSPNQKSPGKGRLLDEMV